ncbi:hypothetical protein C2W62_14645 [Candidatus Entotheonella serta]|nr:hypothetical protein C2W62_14645 [Candidatus Entotheonella serta]
MKALTNINVGSIPEAVTVAREAAAAGRAFAFSGGGTDLLQQIKEGTDQADIIINLRTIREARDVLMSTTETRIGGLITLSDLANHTALSDAWTVLREAAASVGTPQIRNVATLAGNVTQRPWYWYYRNGFNCFKAGGNQCFSVDGENQQHAIFGGGPSFYRPIPLTWHRRSSRCTPRSKSWARKKPATLPQLIFSPCPIKTQREKTHSKPPSSSSAFASRRPLLARSAPI